MKFRYLYSVLSEDFEFSLLLGAINYRINEIQKNGGDAGDLVKAKDKLIFYSHVVEKSVKTVFGGNNENEKSV